MIQSLSKLLMLVLWIFSTNHCILADTLAEPSATPCHGQSSDQDPKSAPKGHHSKCQDKGCCNPALINSGGETFNADSKIGALPDLLAKPETLWLNFEYEFSLTSQAERPPPSEPFIFRPSLLISLASPNAPPCAIYVA